MNQNIKLFSPGPTPLSDTSISCLSAQPIHHRSDDFKNTIKETMELLTLLFDEEHRLVFPSTGSGSLEASVVNFLNPKDITISLDGGKFGARWDQILTAYGVDNTAYKFPWGHTPDPEKVKDLVQRLKPKALYMQACETSTGTRYDIKSVAKILNEESPESLLIVDGVTAVGAYPLSMKELQIDVLISGSQKALGLPVGLSFMGVSAKAYAAALKSTLPKYYFNILNELKALQKNTTVFSSPTQLWQALHGELSKLKQDGLSQKYTSCLELQQAVKDWAQENDFSLFSEMPSPSLTALLLPSSLSANQIQKKLLEKGYYIAKGQDEFSDKLLRIGHMANITMNEMNIFLKTLGETLSDIKTQST